MENKNNNVLEPLKEQDVQVQICNGADCLHDCPPIGLGDNCGPLLTDKK